jgi:ketosteroid isomerase-like protein
MSQANVQIVQASFEAWNAGDMRAWGNLLAPDVIWRPPEEWPEPGPYVGRESVLREVQQLRETWGADAAEPISEFSHSGDRVVARFVWRGRGHGPDANIEVTCVYTLREGKIMAFEFSWDHAEALEAVGQSPKDGSTDFS